MEKPLKELTFQLFAFVFSLLVGLCWPTLDYTHSSASTKSVFKLPAESFNLIPLFSSQPVSPHHYRLLWAPSLASASRLLKSTSVLTHSVWRRGPKIPHIFQDLIGPSEFAGLWLAWSLSCVLTPAQLCSCSASASKGWSRDLYPAAFLKQMNESVKDVDKVTPHGLAHPLWKAATGCLCTPEDPGNDRGPLSPQVNGDSMEQQPGTNDNSTASCQFESSLF